MQKFFELLGSDCQRAYPTSGSLALIGYSLINSSLHACALVRACQLCPGWLFSFFRRLLITLHGIDVGRGLQIGPGLSLPHPVALVIGGGVVIGERCTIFQGVTLGVAHGRYPRVEDDVTIYPNAVIVGEVVLTSGRNVRALTFMAGTQD